MIHPIHPAQPDYLLIYFFFGGGGGERGGGEGEGLPNFVSSPFGIVIDLSFKLISSFTFLHHFDCYLLLLINCEPIWTVFCDFGEIEKS